MYVKMRIVPLLLLFLFVVCCRSGISESATQQQKSPPKLNCQALTTREQYETKYGTNSRPMGGLSINATRHLYLRVLPHCLMNPRALPGHSICSKAQLTYTSKQAAKAYVRSRSDIVSKWYLNLMEAMVTLVTHFELSLLGKSAWTYWTDTVDSILDHTTAADMAQHLLQCKQTRDMLFSDKCVQVCHEMMLRCLSMDSFVDTWSNFERTSRSTASHRLFRKRRHTKLQSHAEQELEFHKQKTDSDSSRSEL